MFCLHDDVKSGDRPGNEEEHDFCQTDSNSQADEATKSSDESCLAQKEAKDLRLGDAKGPEHSDLPPSLDDGNGDGIVDQKHSDDEGDEAEGREVKVEGRNHLFYLTASGFGPTDLRSWRHDLLQLSFHSIQAE